MRGWGISLLIMFIGLRNYPLSNYCLANFIDYTTFIHLCASLHQMLQGGPRSNNADILHDNGLLPMVVVGKVFQTLNSHDIDHLNDSRLILEAGNHHSACSWTCSKFWSWFSWNIGNVYLGSDTRGMWMRFVNTVSQKQRWNHLVCE